jgi:epoxyqueuosine reductase
MPKPPDSAGLKAAALDAGFDAAGIARVGETTPDGDKLAAWLAAGRQGAMDYMRRTGAWRADLRSRYPFARSVLVVEQNYSGAGPGTGDARPGEGLVARYARGRDYHNVMIKKLRRLGRSLQEEFGPAFGDWRVCVDTGAVLEKAWGAAAGLGWIGKNTLLMNQRQGSWFLLGELILSLELEPDPPVAPGCGECTACLDACPTGAIVAPHELDARRCISYLTIETRADFPPKFARREDPWLFGCDICQEVCPWNHFDGRRPEPQRAEPKFEPRPEQSRIPLNAIRELDDEALRARLTGTPLLRPKPAGLKRNASAITRS